MSELYKLFYYAEGQPRNKSARWVCSVFKWASSLLTTLRGGCLMYRSPSAAWASFCSLGFWSGVFRCKQMGGSVCQAKASPGLFAGQSGQFPPTCHGCAWAGQWRVLPGLRGSVTFGDMEHREKGGTRGECLWGLYMSESHGSVTIKSLCFAN